MDACFGARTVPGYFVRIAESNGCVARGSQSERTRAGETKLKLRDVAASDFEPVINHIFDQHCLAIFGQLPQF